MYFVGKATSLQRPLIWVMSLSTQMIRTVTFSHKYINGTFLPASHLLKKDLYDHFSLGAKCPCTVDLFFSSALSLHHQIDLKCRNLPRKLYEFSYKSLERRQGAFKSNGVLLAYGHISQSIRSVNWCRHLHSSSIQASSKTTVELESSPSNDQQSVKINVDNKSMVIPAVWLRDHCMSPDYYNHETQQRNVVTNFLTSNLKIDSVDLTSNGSGFAIFWNDGHVSQFAMDWLQSNFYKVRPIYGTQRLHWNKDLIESQPLPTVSYNDHMTLETGLAETVSNLCKYGFSIVEGCEHTEEATENVVERLTCVQETLYGRMWTFTSDGMRSDTAYSSKALGSHTDLSYMETPAGIQVFHCLKHTGSGGETLLVDGFRSLEIFREAHPEDFDLLTKTVVPHEYKEEPSENSPGYHMYSLGTTIRVHPASDELIQLRFNPYDRAPLDTVSALEIPPFYRAYGRLHKIISDPEGQLWHKLKPGQVLFIDNWRVMHGRAAFDGTRVMCGCYLPRDEWVSKARVLGVW